MAKLSDEQRRLLARSSDGCTEALMMAHGFPIQMLTDLLSSGLISADAHAVRAGSRPIVVVWMQIIAAGRTAIADEA